ncbi:pyroglutamyl-peptidase I [Paracoccus sp. 1_MG-2023]|uniref:pyroglutamyl-peptidase I n=1 Tax=unclassified Paracoccus (in: a-proteobacteria) TaxID=2688777 RepID=UPI001C099954|nr:pyroglutamyl-peptidase I [Paracoccus sp. 1_MG-2023]MBU2959203.1 pyroglutamyl-peptidase I [Paracoccus sp. C2R09]MDO6670060.1 pyroglutamyl-peptidase I [Paracoccus sp. 1_MG-2023]
MQQPRILVAGYGAWAKAENNPAAQVVKELAKRDWTGCEVIGHVMPVNTADLRGHVEDLLTTHLPDAWVGIGVSEAAIVQAEMVGINWRHFDVPDSTGTSVDRQPILPGGPVGYNATLPNAAMVAAMNEAGIPASLSFSAGTHLCNQMLYTTAHVIEERGLPTLSGFIHVPQTPANIALIPGRKRHAASMSLAMTTDALAICIDTLVAALKARHPETV